MTNFEFTRSRLLDTSYYFNTYLVFNTYFSVAIINYYIQNNMNIIFNGKAK